MKIEMEVSDEILENALVGCFEGGASRYWIKHITSVPPKGEDRYVSSSAPFQPGHKVEVKLRESITKDGPTVFNLDCHALKRGLVAMLEKAPRHFGDLIAENDDGTTHDVFLQMCLFGEVIFG